jgi:hypothetical protein
VGFKEVTITLGYGRKIETCIGISGIEGFQIGARK